MAIELQSKLMVSPNSYGSQTRTGFVSSLSHQTPTFIQELLSWNSQAEEWCTLTPSKTQLKWSSICILKDHTWVSWTHTSTERLKNTVLSFSICKSSKDLSHIFKSSLKRRLKNSTVSSGSHTTLRWPSTQNLRRSLKLDKSNSPMILSEPQSMFINSSLINFLVLSSKGVEPSQERKSLNSNSQPQEIFSAVLKLKLPPDKLWTFTWLEKFQMKVKLPLLSSKVKREPIH